MSTLRSEETSEATLLAALVHARNVLNANGGSTEMERLKATIQADSAIAQARLAKDNERIENLVAVIDKQNAEILRLRGQLEAAEQHVKILQAQRAVAA